MTFEQALPPIEPTAAPPDSRGRTPWGYADMAMAIGIVIGGTILVALPAAVVAALIAGGSDVSSDDAALAVLLGANLLLELFLLVAVALFTVRKYKVSWAMVGLRLPERGSWWLPLALLGGALVVIWIYFWILAALGAQPRSNIPDEAFHSVPLTVLVGIISLALAPVMEETFFRGFLFGGLRRYLAFWPAALVSGLIFSLAHFNVGLVIPFTMVGAVLAYTYERSGTLVASIMVHLLFNLTSFSILVLFPELR